MVKATTLPLPLSSAASAALASHLPGLVVVGADEEQALAAAHVRIDRDDGDTGSDGLIDAVFQQIRVGG